MSLREHALAMYNRHYRDTDRFPEYKEKVKQVFGEDTLAQFVMGLRRYCQHYQSPNLRYLAIASEAGERMNHSAVLAVEDLLSFSDWNAPARAFIENCQDVVDILGVAAQYKRKVIEFYQWFQERQSEIHNEEISRFRAKEAELLSLQIRDNVELCLAHKDDMPYRGEEIFSNIFTKRQYDELNELPFGSSERGERALKLLQQSFPVPDDLAQKILELYQHPGFLPRSQSSSPETEAR